VQRLTKAHIDVLVTELIAGGTTTAKGRKRRPWSADSVNKVIVSIERVLADAKGQGLVTRNAAVLVNRVAKPHTQVTHLRRPKSRPCWVPSLMSALGTLGNLLCPACGEGRSPGCDGSTLTST
jgi:hypothetical protein